ncbi:MAG: hypothetical protein M3R00_01130 [Pseudomonadota bacterium]|nr:hypothetical protein [Pseudomonadota bacterium]
MTLATLEKEFYVETSDKAGTASQLTKILSGNGKNNIKSIWGSSHDGIGYFYFIPEDLTTAKTALSASEFKNFREEDVVVAYINDKPGMVAELTSKLAQENINVNWFYTTYYNGKSALIFSSSDNQKALKLFNQ